MCKIAALPLSLVVLLASPLASAQTTDDVDGEDAAGAEVEMGEDPLAGAGDDDGMVDLDGTDENPNDPVGAVGVGGQADVKVGGKAAPVAPAEYPIEVVKRPITLPRRMTEVTLAMPNRFNSYVQDFVLGARHGITDKIQAGLRYGAGSFAAIGGESEFFAGKGFAIDAHYQVFPWLAAQLSVPMWMDPFAIGVSLGAPVQFTFFDKLRIYGGNDLVAFKISRFLPAVDSAFANEALTLLDETGSDAAIPDGEINFNGGAVYQLQPNMAVDARLGIKWVDFESSSDSPTLFDLGLTYSTSNKIDVGGRLGFADLNNAGESFGIYLVAGYRI
ncbi:MAG TPA: hypothetical protein VKZ63_22570 [Kofleriaceae bacterium]|nr:hypothetical protein [Kofleriaceae bacterium]